jgi:4-hydroxybenzoate polyprenyltransferase
MRELNYWLNWAEYFAVMLMIIGFAVSLAIESMWLNFTVVFIAGVMAGRLFYGRRRTTKFTHYLIVIGFLVGYLIGSYAYSKIAIAIIFVGAAILSYYLHSKGYMEKYLPAEDPHKGQW